MGEGKRQIDLLSLMTGEFVHELMGSEVLREGGEHTEVGSGRRRYPCRLWNFGFCKLELCSDSSGYMYAMVEFPDVPDESQKYNFRLIDEHRLRGMTLVEMKDFLSTHGLRYESKTYFPGFIQLVLDKDVSSDRSAFHFHEDKLEALDLWMREDVFSTKKK